MAINELVSKELRVPKLKPGETKTYRRMNKGKIDPQTNEPYILGVFWQQGKQMFQDPYSNQRVLLLNETGSRPVAQPDGSTRLDPIVEAIKWDDTGEILLTESDFEKMCYMHFSNLNASNPYRNARVRAQYFEVNKKKELKREVADFGLSVEAYKHVNIAKMDELRSIAKKLNVSAAREDLRMELLSRIEKGAGREVMIASDNVEIKKRIQVTDAEKYNLIIYNEMDGNWFFSDSPSTNPICTIPLDVEKVEGLIAFFNTKEGSPRYAQLATKVKKLYEAVD